VVVVVNVDVNGDGDVLGFFRRRTEHVAVADHVAVNA